jgi:hypothetical protein
VAGQFEVSDLIRATCYWERGRPRPQAVARQTFERKTHSRFALNAGEGARVPSTKTQTDSLPRNSGRAVLCAQPAAAQPQTLEQQMIQAVEACDLARVSHSVMLWESSNVV